ncbi:MAG: transcriptional regulator, MerR family, partial [Verrucomicrobiales bacterium]|nr:transcriptional regulator, MerR family [Verrucomicrobiales bacterium]
MKPAHSIRAVVLATGLSAHVIRIWEKRYRVVQPARTGTNRRLYSAEDVERLILLREATQAGHSIGAIADLSADALRKLIPSVAPKVNAQPDRPVVRSSDDHLADCVDAIQHLNSRKLEQSLDRAAVA